MTSTIKMFFRRMMKVRYSILYTVTSRSIFKHLRYFRRRESERIHPSHQRIIKRWILYIWNSWYFLHVLILFIFYEYIIDYVMNINNKYFLNYILYVIKLKKKMKFMTDQIWFSSRRFYSVTCHHFHNDWYSDHLIQIEQWFLICVFFEFF